MEFRAVVTVLGEDRVGIVAKLSGVLAQTGTNIEDIRQAVVQGLFTMTMLVTIDETATPFDEVQRRLEEAGEELKLQVTLQREDVFRFMHRI